MTPEPDTTLVLLSAVDRETAKLAWSAIDAALHVPGFSERLPNGDWVRISMFLARLVMEETPRCVKPSAS